MIRFVWRGRPFIRSAVAALVLLWLCLAPATIGAETVTGVGPSPTSVDIGVSQVTAVAIVLDGAQSAYGIDVSGRFDPNVIELVAFAPGAPLAAGGFIKPDFVAINRIDNIAGTFQWVATQLRPSPPVTGTGPLFVLQARGKLAGGISTLEITHVELSDAGGKAQAVALRSGTIRVLSEGGAASPTPAGPIATPVNSAATATPKVIQPAAPPSPTPAQNGQTPTARAAVAAPTATPARPGGPTPAQPAASTGSPLPPTAAVIAVTAQAVPTARNQTGLEPTPDVAPALGAAPRATQLPAATSPTPSARVSATPVSIALAAQEGLAPRAPAPLRVEGAAQANSVSAPSSASAPAADSLTGVVLLVAGLGLAFAFWSTDGRRRRERGSVQR